MLIFIPQYLDKLSLKNVLPLH